MKQYIDRPPPEDDSLPDEIEEMLEVLREEKLRIVDQLGKQVAKYRDEAVRGRKQSGVEDIWREDREYYEGIDDLNRTSSQYSKSASPSGVVERNVNADLAGVCTAFFNITRQFCDAASARMGDILLPAGDWNFAIKPTPIPEDLQSLVGAVETMMQPGQPGQPQEYQQQPGQPGQPGQPESKKEPNDKAEKAETHIRDWLTDCRYHAEVRKVIEDAAIVGTGILEGPVPYTTKQRAFDNETGAQVIVEQIAPASFRVRPEDFFPDPACGENIQNGNYVFKRDNLTAKKLLELKDQEGYLPEAIDAIIDEGPGKRHTTDGKKTNLADDFEVWYFYGDIKTAELEAFKTDLTPCDDKDKNKRVHAIVTMVNDTPIKAALAPLDTGEFPFDVMPWQRKDGCWYGIGVARQGRTAQAMFNSAARALMDNSALSSGPMLIIRDNAIYPADGKWTLTARKIFRATEQADLRSVADAFLPINIPSMQTELNNDMEIARKMMEESTGIYFILQGQQGSAPDTVGGMDMMLRNASTVLRRLARVFDENITEPHINRYYDFLLEHGEDDSEKGDMRIEAIGSTALVEREIQAMQAQSLLQLSLNPAFGIDPEKAITEVLKAQRFNPDKWIMDDDKKQQLSQQPQPVAPQVEAAKIRTEADLKKAAMKRDVDMTRIKSDIDRDSVYSQGVARRDEMTRQSHIEEMQLRERLAMMEYANKNQMTLDKVKADLSKTVMTLNLQEKLSAGQVATPAVEPAGRAPDGQSFQK